MVYCVLVSHRTIITLTDDQYRLLQDESLRTGLSLAALVRRAIADTDGETRRRSEGSQALEAAFGAWDNDHPDGQSLVESMRRGLARRLDVS